MLKAICNPCCSTLPSQVSNVLVCIPLSDLPLAFLEISHPTSANNLMTSAQSHANSSGAQPSQNLVLACAKVLKLLHVLIYKCIMFVILTGDETLTSF